MPGLKENLNCPRRMVVFAVFDVIDKMDGEYDKALAGDIKAKVTVLGKTSQYAFAVTEVTSDTSILHISLLQTLELLTEEEKHERALLRREYLDAVKANLEGQLQHTYLQRPDGTRVPLRKKKD